MNTLNSQSPTQEQSRLDVIIVGGGFGGLYALYKIKALGLSVRLLEAGAGIGGTWFWNRYPGARCDNESVEYSYSFSPELQKEWQWTERYATQPEILSYLEHVAQRFDLYPYIQLNTRVSAAHYDEARREWCIESTAGGVFHARYCVMASGNLSVTKVPDWPGLADFGGVIVHTANWPRAGVDFSAKRVGVVGTGSSGVQVIPQIAKSASKVIVFQRTPNFSVPAKNFHHEKGRPILAREEYDAARVRARQSALGFFAKMPTESALATDERSRTRRYDALWEAGGTSFLLAYNDLLFDEDANSTAANYVRQKIRQLVKDPATGERLTPQGYPIGAKRLCCEIDYYDAFNKPHVELVDIQAHPIRSVSREALITDVASYPVDVLVFATGFDAMVGALRQIDVRGRGGRSLQDEWVDGPHAYLGLMTVGFPNLFLLTGPGSPSALSNVVVSIEQHVDFIADCLSYMDTRGHGTIESTTAAEDAWMQEVDRAAQPTVFMKAKSWYQTVRPDGRRVFMPYLGGVGAYRNRCDQVAAAGYEGFAFDSPRDSQNL